MKISAGIAAIMVLLLATGVQAAAGSVEMRLRALESRLPDADRLAAMEKSQGSQGAAILATDVEQLKADLRELRGMIEQLSHQIQKQQEGQRQLYGDLDQRIKALEAKFASQVVSSVASGTDIQAGASTDSAPATGPARVGQEQADYLAAFELLQQGKTQEAVPAFQAFLTKYPKSDYAANALYWLGEANYVNKNYAQALTEFHKLAEQYPESQKLGGALLKIGYIHYETRKYVEARTVLENVKRSYPHTNVGTLAAERLARMSKEGV